MSTKAPYHFIYKTLDGKVKVISSAIAKGVPMRTTPTGTILGTYNLDSLTKIPNEDICYDLTTGNTAIEIPNVKDFVIQRTDGGIVDLNESNIFVRNDNKHIIRGSLKKLNEIPIEITNLPVMEEIGRDRIALTGYYIFIVTDDGKLLYKGGLAQQEGIGSSTMNIYEDFKEHPTLRDVKSVICAYHKCVYVILKNGDVYVAGESSTGLDTLDMPTFTKIEELSNIVTIKLYSDNVYALDENGDIFYASNGMGLNDGNASYKRFFTKVKFQILDNVKNIKGESPKKDLKAWQIEACRVSQIVIPKGSSAVYGYGRFQYNEVFEINTDNIYHTKPYGGSRTRISKEISKVAYPIENVIKVFNSENYIIYLFANGNIGVSGLWWEWNGPGGVLKSLRMIYEKGDAVDFVCHGETFTYKGSFNYFAILTKNGTVKMFKFPIQQGNIFEDKIDRIESDELFDTIVGIKNIRKLYPASKIADLNRLLPSLQTGGGAGFAMVDFDGNISTYMGSELIAIENIEYHKEGNKYAQVNQNVNINIENEIPRNIEIELEDKYNSTNIQYGMRENAIKALISVKNNKLQICTEGEYTNGEFATGLFNAPFDNKILSLNLGGIGEYTMLDEDNILYAVNRSSQFYFLYERGVGHYFNAAFSATDNRYPTFVAENVRSFKILKNLILFNTLDGELYAYGFDKDGLIDKVESDNKGLLVDPVKIADGIHCRQFDILNNENLIILDDNNDAYIYNISNNSKTKCNGQYKIKNILYSYKSVILEGVNKNIYMIGEWYDGVTGEHGTTDTVVDITSLVPNIDTSKHNDFNKYYREGE